MLNRIVRAARKLAPANEPISLRQLEAASGCHRRTLMEARKILRAEGRWPWPDGNRPSSGPARQRTQAYERLEAALGRIEADGLTATIDRLCEYAGCHARTAMAWRAVRLSAAAIEAIEAEGVREKQRRNHFEGERDVLAAAAELTEENLPVTLSLLAERAQRSRRGVLLIRQRLVADGNWPYPILTPRTGYKARLTCGAKTIAARLEQVRRERAAREQARLDQLPDLRESRSQPGGIKVLRCKIVRD